MEYIEAISLRDWHRKQVQDRKDVPLAVAARIVAEILDGLTAAHGKGIVHRDLKPENILLTDDPTPEKASLKIVDFGIARAAGAPIESGTGTGLGTPRYMAPEQVTNADSAGPSADLYSLSIIFYELLVDVLPQGHWQPPSGGRADIPAAIDRLIERGLANRAASRPQSASEYRQQLVAAMGGYYPPQPVGPGVPVPVAGSAKPVLKWLGIGGGALLAIGVVGAAIKGLDEKGPGDDRRQEVVGGTGDSGGSGGNQGPNYTALTGNWVDGPNQAGYSVQVNPDGSFAGQGTASGEPISLQGNFQGGTANFVAMTGNGQFPGTMQLDGPTHIIWQTQDGSGGCLHINHPPNPPGCPSQR
jgi:serine/threonine protein kinase